MKNKILHRDAYSALTSIVMEDESVDMIYTDPPFGTGNIQTSNRKKSGKTISNVRYDDRFDDYLEFLVPIVRQMHRVLKPTGTMYLHLDYRWVHYVKVECDKIFGKNNFLNEIIWSYNFGGRGKDRFPQKHDTILVYTKDMSQHIFNWDDIDRIPYAAPDLQRVGRSKEEAEKRIASGQVPTDVWSMSIVGTQSKERLGYPSQKPVKLIKRTILASSPIGGVVLDPFAGSGSTGSAALECDRKFILIDKSKDAYELMKKRFSSEDVDWHD